MVEQSDLIHGRDGGISAKVWNRSVWVYGDTVLTISDQYGHTWHHNSFSVTEDLKASDGVGGFEEPLDEVGAPRHLLEPTDKERAFNEAHSIEFCVEQPCGARWATWPGSIVFDSTHDRALISYGLIYAEPGEFNFHGVGGSIAIWDGIDQFPYRPVVDPHTKHPNLLWSEGEPGWGVTQIIEGEDLYSFACDTEGLSHPCKVARVPLNGLLDRRAWCFWNGRKWNKNMEDAKQLFDGAPIMQVSFNAYLNAYLVIYSPPFDRAVLARTAPTLTGHWSEPTLLYTVPEDSPAYDVVHHPEYEEENGRVQYITYSRPTYERFGTEFALVRIQFE